LISDFQPSPTGQNAQTGEFPRVTFYPSGVRLALLKGLQSLNEHSQRGIQG